jgi:hypothetical protein
MYSCKPECDGLVENLKFLLPPSALKPEATATASSSVDLPVPFSPTRNVTGLGMRSSRRFRIAGMQNGYSLKEGTESRLSMTALMKGAPACRI